jgi:hypothetical protein
MARRAENELKKTPGSRVSRLPALFPLNVPRFGRGLSFVRARFACGTAAETEGAPAQARVLIVKFIRWRDFMMRHYKDFTSVLERSHGLKMAPGFTGPEPPAERFFVWPG